MVMNLVCEFIDIAVASDRNNDKLAIFQIQTLAPAATTSETSLIWRRSRGTSLFGFKIGIKFAIKPVKPDNQYTLLPLHHKTSLDLLDLKEHPKLNVLVNQD
jgi:uncharacterized protein YcaQ